VPLKPPKAAIKTQSGDIQTLPEWIIGSILQLEEMEELYINLNAGGVSIIALIYDANRIAVILMD